jgi:hypothetical protein
MVIIALYGHYSLIWSLFPYMVIIPLHGHYSLYNKPIALQVRQAAKSEAIWEELKALSHMEGEFNARLIRV